MPRERMRYSLKQLIKELQEVFPEAEFEVSDSNELGVAHTVTFSGKPAEWLGQFLDEIENDERVRTTDSDYQDDLIVTSVSVKDSNRLSDKKDEWGIKGAADLLGFENPASAYPEGDEVASGAENSEAVARG